MRTAHTGELVTPALVSLLVGNYYLITSGFVTNEREKQTRAEQNGETMKVDQFKQQADSLDNVISRVEGAA